MRFDLKSSPFQNIHKFHPEDLLDYLEPHLRNFAWQYHKDKQSAVPPCAFVFGSSQALFSFGYEFSTSDSFLEHIKFEIKALKSDLVLLISEVNSVVDPTSAALLLTEIQTSSSFYRCAFDLLRSGKLSVTQDWKVIPDSDLVNRIRQEIPDADASDLEPSPLLGVQNIFIPLFPSVI